MTLVHHQMPVAGHNVVHNVAAFKALEHADVDEAPRVALAAAYPADGGFRKIKERTKPCRPLIHQLAAVNEAH